MSRPKPNALTLWHFLLTCGWDRSIPGLINGSVGRIADELGWSYKATKRVVDELVGLDKIKHSERVILLPERVQQLACYPQQPGGVHAWLSRLWEVSTSDLKDEAIYLVADAMRRRDEMRAPGAQAVWFPAYRKALVAHKIRMMSRELPGADAPGEVDLEVDLANRTLNQRSEIKDQVVDESAAAAPSSSTRETDEEQLDLAAEIAVEPAVMIPLWRDIAEPAGFPANRPRKPIQAPALPWRKDGPRELEAALTELLERLATRCTKFARPGANGHRAWTLRSVVPKAVEILAGVYDGPDESRSTSSSTSRPKLQLAPTPPPDESKRFASSPLDSREWRARRKALGLTGSAKGLGATHGNEENLDGRRPGRVGEPPENGPRVAERASSSPPDAGRHPGDREAPS